MDFEKLSAARYSLRKFDSRPVEKEKLALILEAGRNAPTAHNKQPQRMFVIQRSAGKGRCLHGLPFPRTGGDRCGI